MPTPEASGPRPTLRELQLWLRWVIVDPRGVEAALADPRPETKVARRYPTRYREPEPGCRDRIVGDAIAGRRERLSVYAEGYFGRLLEVLEANFEAVRGVVGRDCFRKLSAEYLKARPPSSHDVDSVGEALAEFLAAPERVSEFALPRWLSELARLEDAIRVCFYAPESAIQPTALFEAASDAGDGEAELQLRLDPSARLLELPAFVPSLWRMRRDPSGFQRALQTAFRPGESPRAPVLLCRDFNGDIEVRALETAAHALLKAIEAGAALDEACAALDEAQAPAVFRWFAQWSADGVIRAARPTHR